MMNDVHISNMISPCNGDCVIDPKTNICKGCFRTMDEIIRWPSLNDEERMDIVKKVEMRKLDVAHEESQHKV